MRRWIFRVFYWVESVTTFRGKKADDDSFTCRKPVVAKGFFIYFTLKQIIDVKAFGELGRLVADHKLTQRVIIGFRNFCHDFYSYQSSFYVLQKRKFLKMKPEK